MHLGFCVDLGELDLLVCVYSEIALFVLHPSLRLLMSISSDGSGGEVGDGSGS